MMRWSPLLALIAACGGATPPPSEPGVQQSPVPPHAAEATMKTPPVPLSAEALQALVDDPSRSEADREADRRRKPVPMLAFLGVFEGMSVADIGAGTGYTTELLARAVGPTGRVLGHNTPFVLDRFAEGPWSERLAKPEMANVVRVDRPFDDPLGPENTGLDGAINVLFYHDFVWQEVDRAAHNRAMFVALKPGGSYVVIDAHAAEGDGTTVTKTLHRIERSVIVQEVTAAGFVLADEGEFLRNLGDTRDWNALPSRSGREEFSDKFALRFEKPSE